MREVHAAHVQTRRVLGSRLPQRDLRAATADVHYQPRRSPRQLGHRAEEHETSFLDAWDHIHRVAEDLLRALDELLCVAGAPQRARRHRPTRTRVDPLDAFGEKPQTVEPPRLRRLVENAVAVEPLRQRHPLLEPVDHHEPPALVTPHQQMKAVGPHVDRGHVHGGVCHGPHRSSPRGER